MDEKNKRLILYFLGIVSFGILYMTAIKIPNGFKILIMTASLGICVLSGVILINTEKK